MSLNPYRDEASAFLDAIHATDEPAAKKLAMLQQELALLQQASPDDIPAIRHQLYDLLFLLFELAAQYDVDLDAEWAAGHMRKAAKYL